ncbi:MAG TPA: dephospho-CoA kinase [bacterium]|nr:dephospho-CoA kinase [bacterium]
MTTGSVRIIGVTGGAGSGKSAFARELAKRGARLLDADAVAGELTETHGEIRSALRTAFGEAYFDASGALKRRELGNHVFSRPDALDTLNGIIRPVLLARIQDQIRLWRRSPAPLTGVVDMAILFEAGVEDWFDRVVVVTASMANRRRRLKASRGWSDGEIEMRIRSQMPVREKIRRADAVIRNDGSPEALRRKAADFLESVST